MLNIASHQGNVNQNRNEISPHTVRMAFIKKNTNNRCWQGCGIKGTLVHCWWECKLLQSLWKTVWRFLKKLKTELHMTQQFHSWVYIQKTPYYFEKIVHSNVHSSTVYNCQAMEATEVSINR